jgi:hypothetical protein
VQGIRYGLSYGAEILFHVKAVQVGGKGEYIAAGIACAASVHAAAVFGGNGKVWPLMCAKGARKKPFGAAAGAAA